MEEGGFLYIGPLYDFIFNVLVVLYRLAGENLGIALIAIAILSRLVLIPLSRKQLKNVERNKEMQQKYDEIKKKYKNDKDRQTKELAMLQSQYLPGQLSGCLTLIFQLLLLFQINHVIRFLLKNGSEAFNRVAYGFVDKFEEGYQFNLEFVDGMLNLGKSASNVGVTNFSESWPYLLIAAFLVSTQYFSMKIFSGLSSKDADSNKAKKEKEAQKKKAKASSKGKGDGKDEEMPSFSEVFQDTNKQMMMFFPLILGFFSLNYPSGLSLYFATTSLFVIIQQAVTKRHDLIAKFKKFRGREAKTREVKGEVKSKVKSEPENETENEPKNEDGKKKSTKKQKRRKRKLKKKRK